MAYGIDLIEQNDELVRRLALRWLRAAEPHNRWAKIGKQCVDMLEGRQWSPEAKAKMQEMRRSALTLNSIAPLWRLVMGYQSSNRMDARYVPTANSQSSEDVANILNMIWKAESGRIDLRYTDSEVFADGLTTGRGFWDMRLCFEDNDFGEIKIEAEDPFSIYIDPDADTYDLDKTAAYIQKSVWVSLDEIEAKYGPAAADACENLFGTTSSQNYLSFIGERDISPARFFGSYADEKDYNDWNDVFYGDFVDRQAKRLRLLDTQYKIMQIAPCFVDLETGDKQIIPDEWLKNPDEHHRIQACLDHAEALGNPLKIVKRPVQRYRWSVSCGDVLLHDDWSPFDHYTKIGYFPYFRRGTARGMVEDLIDPQIEKNKKRSVMVDILNRNANSGWIYEDGSLDPEQEENLRRYGSAPGVNVKWKRRSDGSGDRPARIEPGAFPQGLDRLEEKASNDMFQISGINESALGQLDRVQSGRAIEARQRQAVLSIQMYTDNFARSKKIQARKGLAIFQRFYTEERIYRVMGEDSKMAIYEINKRIQTGTNGVTRLNDITVGKYSVEVDEVPVSATFKQAQFEETMMILEKLGPIGAAIAQIKPDLIIDQSSLPRKQDWNQALMQASALASSMGAPDMGQGQPAGAATTPEQMPS